MLKSIGELHQLQENQFIEIFKIEDIDETLFGNYQRYDFYQIMWLTKAGGNPNYLLDFEKYVVEDNQIVIIFPGQIDRLDVRGKEGYIFAVESDIFFRINQRMNSGFLNGYFSNVFLSLDVQSEYVLKHLVDIILYEYNNENRIMLMENYMEAFLFHISSLFEETNKNAGKTDILIPELMRLIDLHYKNERETDFYAEKLNLSCKKINGICKRGTGKTVKQHLQERLILEVKKEIRLGKKSLKEIAFDLGFSEPAYFTRFFKQHTLQTPTEFRDKDPFVQVTGR